MIELRKTWPLFVAAITLLSAVLGLFDQLKIFCEEVEEEYEEEEYEDE